MSSSKLITHTFGGFRKNLNDFSTYTTITFVPLAVFYIVNSNQASKHING